METTYNPQNIEAHWATFWESQGYYQPNGDGKPYCIMLPPPNVTGTLHMGHGFQHTLMDTLIRKNRMSGRKTLWQAGTDHAGIATQMLIERQLAKEGKSRHDIGRDAFLKRVWKWREQSGQTITQQIRRMGASIDWTRERFSMDQNIRKATIEAFIRLYDDGLIYRGKRLVNWDPQLNTAISDLEVVTTTDAGKLWHIRYPLSDGSGYLIIATTRPETLLGDTAVAVHPDDERYQAFIGKTIRLPLTERDIPIVADTAVEQDFATGCVKITPAHDFVDYELGQRHQLPMINILTPEAKLNDQVPTAYQGLDRMVAREKVLSDLAALDLIEKTEAHQINVPRGDRSGAIIEPMLTDQWFVKAKSLAQAAIEVVESGKLTFVPNNWTKTYLLWLHDIQDWCISRQLWWGHRIPVWYDSDGNHYVGFDEADVRKRNQLAQDIPLKQDSDILDTWFSAALWPFSGLGWPDNEIDLQAFYPTDVLVTGFDIIFFWVARMVMMGLKLIGEVPFREVYITGLIRDHEGQKMSKTKGNVLDPIDLIDGIALEPLIEKRKVGLIQPQMAKTIEKMTRESFPNGIAAHGTDALRFTFCALASTGRDINFDMGRIEGYRNFCNKLWNASRFVIMNVEQHNLDSNQAEFSLADRWITSALQDTIEKVHTAFQRYRFDLLAQTLYEFIWNQFCDWYLELAKCRLNDTNASEAQLCGTRYTLAHVLETCLRLLHPIMPYITEEIWQKIAPLLKINGDTIMLQPYPEMDAAAKDTIAQKEIEWLQQLITGIRNIRGEMNVSPAKKIEIILNKGEASDQQRMNDCKHYLKTLSKVERINWATDANSLPASATTLVDHLEIYIPLAGLIDKKAELTRLEKEINKLKKEQEKSTAKLSNENYITKAPKHIVAKEQQRLEQVKNNLAKLETNYDRILTL